MSSAAGVSGGRRAFLTGRLLTEEGRRRYRAEQRPLGPAPPWSRSAVEEGRCLACPQACVEACPERLIRLHPPAHPLAGRPYLSFADAGCTLCGACAEACPARSAPSDPAPVLGVALLDTRRCLAWNAVVCLSCSTRCAAGALRRDRRGRPSIEAAACSGCGGCVSVCPVGALEVAIEPRAPRPGASKDPRSSRTG